MRNAQRRRASLGPLSVKALDQAKPGDTGDAFETPFHLHFEIHPRSLLSLRYDGAVDPTTYLEHWQRLSHVRGSRPLHPALPTGTARTQA
ncbi:MAG: hypothetical protein ACM3Q0_02315 [Bacteroidota bacterium]